ncbi:MAG: TIGR04255 family protein [Pirellulales bacterium]
MSSGPNFARPPVVEVVMGVQMHPLRSFLAPHTGLFWQEIRAEYPNVREAAIIGPQQENFSAAGAFSGGIGLEFGAVPPFPRVIYSSEQGDWLTQVQRDRFLHNWVLIEGQEYPRYEAAVRDRFHGQWGKFRDFVDAQGLGEIRIAQLELTYLNLIDPWTAESELSDLLPDFHWRTGGRYLGSPEAAQVGYVFGAATGDRRLRMNFEPGVRGTASVLRLELTVRGTTQPNETLESWFDGARVWIVNAFRDLTGPTWHDRWGLQ